MDVLSIAGGVRQWTGDLAAAVFTAASDDGLLALVESLEHLKDACSAAQARAVHEYSERRLTGLTIGSDEDRVARQEIGARVARARHVSPFHGRRHLELSRMLVSDLPATLDALAEGRTNEHRAGLIANAAACLGRADRAALDVDLAPRLAGMGNLAVRGEAERLAATLDPLSVVERHRRAVKDRRVTLRPAPDTMTYLTALLPVADGVAAWAALDRHATAAKASGDSRTRGQIMADALAERLLAGAVTGTTGTADADADPVVPVTVSGALAGSVAVSPSAPAVTRQIDLMVVMTDRALLDGADTPAVITGFGPVPATLARELVATADRDTRVFLRRLYTDPSGDRLLSADARGRLFPHAVRQFILARDQRCRTPWCDAPIRTIDHRIPHARGGATTVVNAEGLCERCNLAKAARTGPDVQSGPAPRPPRSAPWGSGSSDLPAAQST